MDDRTLSGLPRRPGRRSRRGCCRGRSRPWTAPDPGRAQRQGHAAPASVSGGRDDDREARSHDQQSPRSPDSSVSPHHTRARWRGGGARSPVEARTMRQRVQRLHVEVEGVGLPVPTGRRMIGDQGRAAMGRRRPRPTHPGWYRRRYSRTSRIHRIATRPAPAHQVLEDEQRRGCGTSVVDAGRSATSTGASGRRAKEYPSIVDHGARCPVGDRARRPGCRWRSRCPRANRWAWKLLQAISSAAWTPTNRAGR